MPSIVREEMRRLAAEANNPRHLAQLALAALDPADYEETLADVLPLVAVQVLGTTRRARLDSLSAAIGASTSKAEVRNLIAGVLDAAIPIGGGQWRALGRCTYENIMYAVAQDDKHIAATQARRDQLKMIADLLRDHGVAVVADLPAADLHLVDAGAL